MNVKGWKQVYTKTASGVTLLVFRNENTVQYYLEGTITIGDSSNVGGSVTVNFAPPYTPIRSLSIPMRHWHYDRILIGTDGSFNFIRTNNTTIQRMVDTGCTFILKE